MHINNRNPTMATSSPFDFIAVALNKTTPAVVFHAKTPFRPPNDAGLSVSPQVTGDGRHLHHHSSAAVMEKCHPPHHPSPMMHVDASRCQSPGH
jgi:hypothetical protein